MLVVLQENFPDAIQKIQKYRNTKPQKYRTTELQKYRKRECLLELSGFLHVNLT